MAEKEFKASDFRLFIGHSRYGYFTSSLLFSRINELIAIISISPFFLQKNVSLTDSIQWLQNQNFYATKYYFFGIGNDYPSDYMKMDSALQKITNPHLNAKGFFFEEAEHNATPGLTIGVSLYRIFEKWSAIQSNYISNDQKEVESIYGLEDEIMKSYGSRLEFSLGVLNGKGWYFYNEGQLEKAIEAWQVLMTYYPNFSEGYLYIMDAQMQLKTDYSLSLRRFHASLERTDFYTESEKAELLQELEDMLK